MIGSGIFLQIWGPYVPVIKGLPSRKLPRLCAGDDFSLWDGRLGWVVPRGGYLNNRPLSTTVHPKEGSVRRDGGIIFIGTLGV